MLAALEDSAGRDDPALHVALTAPSQRARLFSRSVPSFAAFLLLAAGAAVMLATFATWPAIGVLGVAIQAVGLWMVASRWAPTVAAGILRWSKDHLPALPSG